MLHQKRQLSKEHATDLRAVVRAAELRAEEVQVLAMAMAKICQAYSNPGAEVNPLSLAVLAVQIVEAIRSQQVELETARLTIDEAAPVLQAVRQ